MRRQIGLVPAMVLNLVAALTTAGSVSPAVAADAKGVIAGRVLDVTGSILQGAQVQLQGKDMTVPSNAQGEFALSDLTPGTYKLQVSYVGLPPLRERDHRGRRRDPTHRRPPGSGLGE
ncbi:MAG: carboxypeptidase-like regulatory domain-containing protein [Ignavibacteriota bacterium]